MSGSMQLTIVVACRNERRHIRELLDSILAQDMGGMTWEAIVADGMSDDGTREILREYSARDPRLCVVDNPRRVVSPGLNAAIRAARGAMIIRMDAHTCYAPDYCRKCVTTLERTGADNAGGPARTRTQGTRARAFAAAYHSRFSTGARFHDENYEGWIDTVPYGCWRKETLERLGLFDEHLVRNQDDELNLRLIRAGGKIWQSPDIVSWYSPRATLKALFVQYFQYGFWKAAVIRKHKLPGSWRHLIPVTFVAAHIALFVTCALTALRRLKSLCPGRRSVGNFDSGVRACKFIRVRRRGPKVRVGHFSLSAGGIHRVSHLLGVGLPGGLPLVPPGGFSIAV